MCCVRVDGSHFRTFSSFPVMVLLYLFTHTHSLSLHFRMLKYNSSYSRVACRLHSGVGSVRSQQCFTEREREREKEREGEREKKRNVPLSKKKEQNSRRDISVLRSVSSRTNLGKMTRFLTIKYVSDLCWSNDMSSKITTDMFHGN